MRSRFVPLLMTFLVFAVMYAFAYYRFSSFGTMRIVGNLLRDNAYWGIAAIGMTFVIISGGIDLSVGSVIAFTGVFCALTIDRYGWNPLVTFMVMLTIGTTFGATMGFFIHRFKIPAFIATLSGLFLARGMAYVLSTDSIRIDHPIYEWVSDLVYVFPDRGRFTFAAGAFLLVLFGGIFVAHFTKFGRNIYALGGNPDAALLLGVPVGRTTISVYALSSFLATFAGIVLSLSKHSGDSSLAVGLELDVIAAVVIGGTLLTGGVGYVIGTFIAVMTLGTIQIYLVLDGSLTPWWIKIVIGVLLFSFVVLQKVLSSRKGLFGRKQQASAAT
ncbi:MAG: galactofuranose ABC transporter, permease protein YjfF [Aggregatilineales bacterium]